MNFLTLVYYLQYILNAVADDCYSIATNQCGCCVLQHCIEFSYGDLRERLVAEITANALQLSEDRFGCVFRNPFLINNNISWVFFYFYVCLFVHAHVLVLIWIWYPSLLLYIFSSNYVVQYILGLREPHITANLLGQLNENFAYLSRNKYGSHVVQKCLKDSGEQHSLVIIMELLQSPDFSMTLLDPYGNYVIQSALSESKVWIVSLSPYVDYLLQISQPDIGVYNIIDLYFLTIAFNFNYHSFDLDKVELIQDLLI